MLVGIFESCVPISVTDIYDPSEPLREIVEFDLTN